MPMDLMDQQGRKRKKKEQENLKRSQGQPQPGAMEKEKKKEKDFFFFLLALVSPKLDLGVTRPQGWLRLLVWPRFLGQELRFV